MSIGGWGRLYVIYIIVGSILGYLFIPSGDFLSATVERGTKPTLFQSLRSDSSGAESFNRLDCSDFRLKESKFKLVTAEELKADPFADLMPAKTAEPYRQVVSCSGDYWRFEAMLIFLALICLPGLLIICFAWVRRGFEKHA